MKNVLFALGVVFALAGPASSGDWFTHEFGELRAYHGDWLNVCASNGDGQCRAVQYEPAQDGSAFFGEARLALYYETPTRYVAEIYAKGLVADQVDGLVLDFGGAVMQLAPGEWQLGGAYVANLAETVAIVQPELAHIFEENVRRYGRLNVSFLSYGAEIRAASFSLRGSDAALRAIDAYEAGR